MRSASLNGKLFAIGGRINGRHDKSIAANEEYDPATDRWRVRGVIAHREKWYCSCFSKRQSLRFRRRVQFGDPQSDRVLRPGFKSMAILGSHAYCSPRVGGGSTWPIHLRYLRRAQAWRDVFHRQRGLHTISSCPQGRIEPLYCEILSIVVF